MKDIDRFQESTNRQDVVNKSSEFYMKGMMEEFGEIMGIEKRLDRGDYDPKVDRKSLRIRKIMVKINAEQVRKMIIDESGDFMWYFARYLASRKIKISEILDANNKKVKRRLKNKTILGSGNR